MKEIELKLVTNNAPAIKGVRELAVESQKLYTNTEKQQKRQVGLIEDIEQELGKLQEAQKKALTIEHIEKYNKKIDEAKKNLQEYNEAGVKSQKQTESWTTSIGKWALSIGGAAAILKVLKDAMMETTGAINAFNIASAVTKQLLYNLTTNASSLANGLGAVIKAQKELNALRLQEKVDTYNAKIQQVLYNKSLVEAHDQMKTGKERIEAYDKALAAHNKMIDLESRSVQQRLNAVTSLLNKSPDNEKLKIEYADLQTRLLELEVRRYSGQKEVASMRSGLIKKEIQDELDWRKKLHDDLQRLADEEIEINKKKAEEIEKDIKENHKNIKELYKKLWDEMVKQEKTDNDFDKNFRQLLGISDKSLGIQTNTNWLSAIKAGQKAISEQNKTEVDDTKSRNEQILDAAKDLAASLNQVMDEMYQNRVNDAQRTRELAENRLQEAQNDLDAEIELYKAGYASNVAAKQKEIEQLKAKRDRALKDEQKAVAAQRKYDTITQASSLITASANIYKALSKLGPIGVVLAIGTIATMLTAFAVTKNQINKTTKLARGGHGMVNGRLHSEGGEPFLNHVEVEQGERWGVLSRSASRKYGKVFGNMVDSFNREKLPVPKNGININNISVQNDGPNRRLDEVNNNLKHIRNKEEVSVIGNMTIYKKGNTTRIVKR